MSTFEIVILVLAIVVPIMAAILVWLLKEFYSIKTDRQRVVWVHNTAVKTFKLPAEAPDDLKLEFMGKPLEAIHEYTFAITNQSFETVTSIKLVVRLGTSGRIVDARHNDRIETRESTAYLMGHSQVVVKLEYLNSSPILKDELKLRVFSEKPIDSVSVMGGGRGWVAKYRGGIEEGPVIVSIPTSQAFIAVEGPIGVGKTTLAELLQQAWSTDLLLERFEENPFLKDFYGDRDLYAFQTQLHFLMGRYEQLKDVEKTDRPLVSDYIFDKDRIFAKLNLEGQSQLGRYFSVFFALRKQVIKPDFVIYLKADVDVLLKRIETRGRPYERNMDREYVKNLCLTYDSFFDSYDDTPVLPIDTTNRDIVNNEADRCYVLDLIQSTFASPLS